MDILFSKLNFLAPWFLRLGLGVAFIIHGYFKFPLPPAGLVEYFGLSPFLSSVVAISEVGSGVILIISGFIKGPLGNLFTRISALTITIIMINVFAIGHPDWFFTTKLFTSEQIFLFLISLYFFIKGNN